MTHQRLAIWRALRGMQHPSPEQVYEQVRRRLPSMSLATVYKNLRTFIEHGLIGEVSLHHGTARLETNTEAHYHLVCANCRCLTDIEASQFEPVRLRFPAPDGFEVQRFSVEAVGLCRACAAAEQRNKTADRPLHKSRR